MARLYQRKGSPFFQIEFRNESGELRRESTRLRTDKPTDMRAANRLLQRRIAEERRLDVFHVGSAWELWVVRFLEQHCVRSASTLAIYKTRWGALSQFLRGARVGYPCQVHYQHAFDFLAWRKAGEALKAVSHNMAMCELDLLKMLMNEAVRRDYAVKNPLLRLRIAREPRKAKLEIAPEDLQKIRQALQDEPDWMTVQFEIGLYSGRRISETRIDLDTVDLERGEYLVRVKGGKTVGKPFHPALQPLFARLKAAGQRWTHEVAAKKASKAWYTLFRRLKMAYSFHCLRVTFVSVGRRAGVDRWSMMQLVDHASATVHEVYSRYSEADHRQALARIIPDAIPRIAELPQQTCDRSASEAQPASSHTNTSC